MNVLISVVAVLFVSTISLAAQPKATICSEKAIENAMSFAQVNNSTSTDYTKIEPKLSLVRMDHGDSGDEDSGRIPIEIWSVTLKFDSRGYVENRAPIQVKLSFNSSSECYAVGVRNGTVSLD